MPRTGKNDAQKAQVDRIAAELRDRAEFERSQRLDRRCPGMATFIRRHGRSFDSQAMTIGERKIVEAAISRCRRSGPFEFNGCFANSQRLVSVDASDRLSYVEGYAAIEGALTPFPHGWVTINGKVVDVTAGGADSDVVEPLRVLGKFTSRAYFGVSFRRDYVQRRIKEAGRWQCLIDDWERGYPLLGRDYDARWRARD